MLSQLNNGMSQKINIWKWNIKINKKEKGKREHKSGKFEEWEREEKNTLVNGKKNTDTL